MSTLALPTSETVFWLIALGLVVVVVLGVFALIVTLLYLVRSVSKSIVQLREVAEAQAAEAPGTEPPAAPGQSGTPGHGAVPEAGPAAGTEARNGEPGRGADAE